MAGYRKLGRKSSHRNLMLRNLTTSLLENGKIKTTVTRAKEVRRQVEKMITLGKRGDLHARRQAAAYMTNPKVVQKLFDEIASNFSERKGGYTRMYKLGPRRGDAAPMVILELVEGGSVVSSPKKSEKTSKKEVKATKADKLEEKTAEVVEEIAEEVKEEAETVEETAEEIAEEAVEEVKETE